MSETFGISAQGTILYRSIDPNWPDNAPQGGVVDFQPVAELGDITFPALTRNPIETTTHNQDDDRYIVGIRRHGECTFPVNFIPYDGSHDHITGLQQSWFDGDRDIWKLQTPDGTAWLFSGFVSNFEPQAPVDDKLTADTTIRPTGRHAWVEAL